MKKRFHKVHIEISNVCNLQCSFCPEVVRTKKLMDKDLFREIVKQVAPMTEQVAFHLMGDPLVHPKLQEFVEICDEYEARIFFVTNAVLLKERQSELLLHPAFRQVNFSLHSFHDNFPERDASEYLQRVFDYTDRALAIRPDLYINYRLWNLQDVRGQASQNRAMLKKIGEYFQSPVPAEVDVRRQKSFRLKGRLYLHFDTEFVWPDPSLPELGKHGTCYGLHNHFGVLADGTVVPCCLDKEGRIALGNVKDTSIGEILASPRAVRLMEGFRRRHLTEELCRRCNYIERFQKPLDSHKQPTTLL